MRHDQHGARRDVGGRRADEGHRILAGLAGGFQHHHTFIGEQRRAEQFGQFTGLDLAGPQPVNRDVGTADLGPHRRQHLRDGPFDQQFLVTEDQV